MRAGGRRPGSPVRSSRPRRGWFTAMTWHSWMTLVDTTMTTHYDDHLTRTTTTTTESWGDDWRGRAVRACVCVCVPLERHTHTNTTRLDDPNNHKWWRRQAVDQDADADDGDDDDNHRRRGGGAGRQPSCSRPATMLMIRDDTDDDDDHDEEDWRWRRGSGGQHGISQHGVGSESARRGRESLGALGGWCGGRTVYSPGAGEALRGAGDGSKV